MSLLKSKYPSITLYFISVIFPKQKLKQLLFNLKLTVLVSGVTDGKW